jgi:hypothetical protein
MSLVLKDRAWRLKYFFEFYPPGIVNAAEAKKYACPEGRVVDGFGVHEEIDISLVGVDVDLVKMQQMLENGGTLDCGELDTGGFAIRIPVQLSLRVFEALTSSSGFKDVNDVRARTVSCNFTVRGLEPTVNAVAAAAASMDSNGGGGQPRDSSAVAADALDVARVASIDEESALKTLRANNDLLRQQIEVQRILHRNGTKDLEEEVAKVCLFISLVSKLHLTMWCFILGRCTTCAIISSAAVCAGSYRTVRTPAVPGDPAEARCCTASGSGSTTGSTCSTLN